MGSWALWIAFSFTPESPPQNLVCVVKAHLGFECPACGITRGLTSLAHGRFREAYHYYSPVYPVFIGLWIALIGALLPNRIWGKLMHKGWFTTGLIAGAGIIVIWILGRWIIRLLI